MTRLAVVVFNLGGPDRPEAVKPFLFNLFNDPAIIGLPTPFRWLLARVISARRAPVAAEIYAGLGGRSPILPETERQARALEAALTPEFDARVFIAMRYWHPFSDETAAAVAEFQPDRVVLLPLYPQFSTTTTESSLMAWHRAAARAGVSAPTSTVCCYPIETNLVAAQAALIKETIAKAGRSETPPRILFSAHGLPEKVIKRGDPYQYQVERTCQAVATALGETAGDWRVCYQSRVGPLAWIGPSTSEEIAAAGREGRAIAVVPIAFVSEHSETLVELDVEYRELAEQSGVPLYLRVPTVGVHEAFIDGLRQLVHECAAREGVAGAGGRRLCPAAWRRCAMTGGTDES